MLSRGPNSSMTCWRIARICFEVDIVADFLAMGFTIWTWLFGVQLLAGIDCLVLLLMMWSVSRNAS